MKHATLFVTLLTTLVTLLVLFTGCAETSTSDSYYSTYCPDDDADAGQGRNHGELDFKDCVEPAQALEAQVAAQSQALTSCQSQSITKFVNDTNGSWAMQSCNWNQTSAAGRKLGFCLGYNGTKYEWTFEPGSAASGTYGGFVYGRRQLVGRTDWLIVPGAYANGLSGACQCGQKCLYYVNVLVAL